MTLHPSDSHAAMFSLSFGISSSLASFTCSSWRPRAVPSKNWTKSSKLVTLGKRAPGSDTEHQDKPEAYRVTFLSTTDCTCGEHCKGVSERARKRKPRRGRVGKWAQSSSPQLHVVVPYAHCAQYNVSLVVIASLDDNT
jgi:hypothetical protein